MNKYQFLQHADVSKFIDWLYKELPIVKFNLKFAPSRYVPGGLLANNIHFNELLPFYRWQTRWSRADGRFAESIDWISTKASIAELKEWLSYTVLGVNDKEFGRACTAVLEWGGVLGARSFIEEMARNNQLIKYMVSIRDIFGVSGNKNIEDLSNLTIKKFNSGLTKIHAFLDNDGLPIYDSRVGAAIAMFYALYLSRTGYSASPLLSFPVGCARGNQVRDPAAILNTNPAPKFYSNAVEPYKWAQAQLKLGWIIESLLLSDQDLFSDEGALGSRCHAFEAGLFIIGYDLRCFFDLSSHINHGSIEIDENNDPIKHKPSRHGWVPTGHSFSNVIHYFCDFISQSKPQNNVCNEFSKWLIRTGKCSSLNTAYAYLFPLKEFEFDLLDKDINILKIVANGGRQGLESAIGSNTIFMIGEERERVCLVDVWLTGQVYLHFPKRRDLRQKYLIEDIHAAGTPSAADTLMAVGRNVGTHFDLLDLNTFQPTLYYNEFFKGFQF